MKEERKISISDYLKARVNERVSLIKKEFTNEADLENYRRWLKWPSLQVKEKLAQNLGIEDFLSRSSRQIVEKFYRKDLMHIILARKNIIDKPERIYLIVY